MVHEPKEGEGINREKGFKKDLTGPEKKLINMSDGKIMTTFL